MTKKKSTVQNQQPPVAIPVGDTRPFGRTFILKDNLLTPESEFPEQAEFLLMPPMSKQDCSSLIFANRALIFGEKTIGLNAKSDVNANPWDAFIFDFSDQAKPRLYLLAIASGITETMLTMITLNACIAKKENRTGLTAQLVASVSKDKRLKKAFDTHLAEGSSFELLLEQTVSKSLRGLCITTVDDQDGIRLFNSYRDVHSHSIDVIYLRKYRVGKSTVLSVAPPFSELKTEAPKLSKEKIIHTEADHFAYGTDVVRNIYETLKKEALKLDKNLIFVPNSKHYIAMKKPGEKNAAFFHFRKNTMYLVVKVEEKIVRRIVKHHDIRHLQESVCKFWGAASTGLVISSTGYLKEIVEVLKKLIKQ